MKKSGYVRINEIILENFKNVEYGKITLNDKSEISTVSLLGIYGQNGSGKTAVIDALKILSCALKGEKLSENSAELINVESEWAKLTFGFSVNLEHSSYIASYEFKLGHQIDDADSASKRAVIYDEKLKASYTSDHQAMRLASVMNTEGFNVFGPDAKFKLLTQNDKEKEIPLLLEKMLASRESRSFIFSPGTVKILFEGKKQNASAEFLIYNDLITRLIYFAKAELFIIDAKCSGTISLDALPLSVKYDKKDEHLYGSLLLLVNHTQKIGTKLIPVLENLMSNINLVLSEIVPGLSLKIKNHGPSTSRDGEEENTIELLSERNGKLIPLKYESDGIKKIISILQLMIVAYNTPSITIAVDEFDSGIFEYLLGELLRIMSEEAEGQLIFTSHNLRPLETIDKSFLVFSTANPKNRYIRMENIQENNNLRNVYFRDIQMDNQKETIYERTSNNRITNAFIAAGEFYDFE